METQDEQETYLAQSDSVPEDYWPAPTLREKGLPSPISALCGAILVAGLGWTLFGSIGGAPAADLSVGTTLESDAAAPATDETSNVSMDQAALETAAAALDGSASALTEAEASVVEPAVAVLTCRVQSMAVDAWRCIYPANDYDNGGYLKVSGGGEITRYGPTEVMRVLSGSTARIELDGNYAVEVQANGDSDYTLRLEIRRGGSVIYQDEGSEYDTLRASE